MLESDIVTLTTQALVLATKVVAPLLVVSLVVGLVVSLLQAVFQVQDQVLSMVPRLAACCLVLVLTGSWMLHTSSTTRRRCSPRSPTWSAERAVPTSQVLDLHVTEQALSVFLLVLARTSAWVVVVPLFTPRGIPGLAKTGLAAGLSLFLTPLLSADIEAPVAAVGYALSVAGQVAIGLVLGFLTQLVFSAVDVAGGLADYASGFSYGAMLDPVSGAQSAAFARLTTVTFLSLLMVTEGYRTVFAGFVSSFRALPLDHLPSLSASTGQVLGNALSGVFVAALQIGAPLLGVLFLTEVALAMAGRFVPQANAVSVGLPVKALVALSATGAMLALLPARCRPRRAAVRLGGQVLR